MNLCSDGHEEICFEGRSCPLCVVLVDLTKEKEVMDDELKELQMKCDDLETEVNELRERLSDPLVNAVAEARHERAKQQSM